ncbi:hypothetical protein CYY_004701 [Polysphondylium violaceum]|uniref:Arylamine N-acetyltransferase n=1 Tax=Polysphondylium violaceum TaxID=133409 RepID=A0A8J4V7I4_9MYCE|nr:hypothetical protein CYY_004701 [Polysphondylium violaceum]
MKAYQTKTSYNNLNVLDGTWTPLTYEIIHRKVLIEKTGGLCFHINVTFNQFLKYNGMDAELVKAIKSDKNIDDQVGYHIFNVVNHNGKRCLVDVAAGAFSSLAPVPIDCKSDNDIIIGLNGTLCRSICINDGSFLYQTKFSNQEEWTNIYNYKLIPISGLTEINEAQIHSQVQSKTSIEYFKNSNNNNEIFNIDFALEKAKSAGSSENEESLLNYYESFVDDITQKETKLMQWDILHWATLKNHNQILDTIIKNRKQINNNATAATTTLFKQDKFGVSPLHIAASRNNLESLCILLDNGCDPNVRDTKPGIRLSSLHLAVNQKEPNIKIIEKLIQSGANVNQEATDRKTPIFHACSASRLDIIKLLVEAGAKVALQDNPKTNGWEYYRVTSPLHISVSKGDLQIVEYLLSNGGKANQILMDDVGESLLHVAALNGDVEMTKLLISKGANINCLDCYEATPLDYAESGMNSNKDYSNFIKQTFNAKYGKGRKM